MKCVAMVSLFLSGTLVAGGVLAATPSVIINAPADGATLDAMEQNKVDYEAVPGPRGDHLHVYVDGTETALLRQLKGTYTLDTLAPGAHEICIKVVNKNHTPIGVGKCVNVTVD